MKLSWGSRDLIFLRIAKPPTTDRQPTTNHRPPTLRIYFPLTDRLSTIDPPTIYFDRQTDLWSPSMNPPTVFLLNQPLTNYQPSISFLLYKSVFIKFSHFSIPSIKIIHERLIDHWSGRLNTESLSSTLFFFLVFITWLGLSLVHYWKHCLCIIFRDKNIRDYRLHHLSYGRILLIASLEPRNLFVIIIGFFLV